MFFQLRADYGAKPILRFSFWIEGITEAQFEDSAGVQERSGRAAVGGTGNRLGSGGWEYYRLA